MECGKGIGMKTDLRFFPARVIRSGGDLRITIWFILLKKDAVYYQHLFVKAYQKFFATTSFTFTGYFFFNSAIHFCSSTCW